ncbi:hypothetical protein RGQ15_20665 [Paracoccus sp. MBLB3053]|uniref:Uncharacterized protein n=1 Tax=Paracoccus aurantius TaxID=3073814 RepID=A0ABU2HY46_9RHOB|nr:hypothetical protein [Paracoccus sp. MBLB3053]MDS9469966.1 hypothetical protein [Paracoccus sp. MBLB3053]
MPNCRKGLPREIEAGMAALTLHQVRPDEAVRQSLDALDRCA